MGTSLSSITPDFFSHQLKQALSGATLLWAFASLSVIALRAVGLNLSYEHALPGVVLLAWIGAECSARLPARLPIAVCGKCDKVTVLSTPWFRRLWPWRYCVSCGSDLHYQCDQKHLLSLFENEKPAKSYFCSKCGTPVPARTFSADEFDERLRKLLVAMPDGYLPSFYASALWRMLNSIPAERRVSEEYWQVVERLVLENCPADASRTESLLIALMAKADKSHSSIPEEKRVSGEYWQIMEKLVLQNCPADGSRTESLLIALIAKAGGTNSWSSRYWDVQKELIQARPKDPAPTDVLECVDHMLKGSGIEEGALTKMQQEVKDALEKQNEKDGKELFGL